METPPTPLPALVLLPGMDGTGDLFQGFQEALTSAIETTVVRYPREEPRSREELFRIVESAIPERKPYVLLAESFSGPLAIELAARRPEGLCGLILCCTYASHPLPWFLRWMKVVARPRFLRKPLPASLVRRNFLGRGAADGLVTAIQAAVGAVSPEVLASRMQLACGNPVVDRLTEIRVPTLCLHARHDRILGRHCRPELEAGIPNAQHRTLEGPHLLLQGKPKQTAAEIIAFLATLEHEASA